MAGLVVFVGAGPGAADLLTLRGARWLAQADVVLADALTDPALRAMAPQARWIDVGKRGYCASTEQGTIDALLVRLARQHRVIVRLKGGDPSLFGRLEEELLALAANGIECQVVPGVTAALAAAADTRRPLTRRGRGRSVTLATAVTRDSLIDWAPVAATHAIHAPCAVSAPPTSRRADTEVFYMAGRRMGTLARRLLAGGWPADTPVQVVSRAGWPDMLSSTHALADLPHAALLHAGRPSVVTVGAGASSLTRAVDGTKAAPCAASGASPALCKAGRPIAPPASKPLSHSPA